MLYHKEAIIFHLSWTSLFLGFHNRGLYVHNDVMLDFGTPEKQIWIETSICSMDTIGSRELIETLAWAHERTPLANLI
ncbi:hypothetical protein OROHE_027567 [Orobanche hederae]